LCSIPTIQTFLQNIVNVHLNHALSLQKEQETPQEQHPKPNQEESQDEYGQFDLNWDDPMVLAALNNAAEPAPVPEPVLRMQYTYQSLIEVGRSILMLPILELKILTIDPTRQHFKNAVASPTLIENMIGAFENRRQQDRLRTGAESVS
jgi:hypothetical protein